MTIPPTPSPSQSSQEPTPSERLNKVAQTLLDMSKIPSYGESACRLLGELSLQTVRGRNALDAHTAGLRREVEAERKVTAQEIAYRDANEHLFNQLFNAVVGALPEYSKSYGMGEALADAMDKLDTLRADLARLTAALEESGRDSERLDWLGEKHRSLSAFYTEASLPLWTAQYDAGHLTPRSAIDAARSAARKEGRT